MKKVILLIATMCCFIYKTQAQCVTRIAGINSSSAGYSGDGGLATSAALQNPNNLAFDAAGNLYIADAANNVIRKVDTNTGIITTVVGTGAAGFSGDGGLANNAQLNGVIDIKIVGSDMYLVDQLNQRIRKVTANNGNFATGTITTIAGTGSAGFSGDGGQAAQAQFDYPRGLAIASAYIYVTDYNNSRIRRIDIATGTITTIAGNGTQSFIGDGGQATNASLNGPTGMALDTQNNLYFTDQANHCVRKINLSTGIITTVAGTGGSYGFSGDGGLATFAELDAPMNVEFDTQGNLWISDYNNKRIRKVNATTGFISTEISSSTEVNDIVGNMGNAGLSGPRGLAFDSQGALYIADRSSQRVLTVRPSHSLSVTSHSITLCSGQSVTVIANSTAPYTSAYTYTWWATTSNGIYVTVSTSSVLVLTQNGTNTYTYYVSSTNDYGCYVGITNIVVHQNTSPSPTVSVSGSGTICVNETANLTASGANTYTWSNNQNGASISVSPNVTTTYYVQGTDNNGCTDNNSVTLFVDACTGINELKNESLKLRVYPNPVSSVINVELGVMDERTEVEIYVYDILGNTVIHNSSLIINNSARVNVRELKSGIYFIKIGNAMSKFVKE